MPERFAVVVSVNRRTNHDPIQLLDLARRQTDYLGRKGIEAKRGQRDPIITRKGLLRLEYGDRDTARAFQDRVAAMGYNELETKRLRIEDAALVRKTNNKKSGRK